MIGEYAIGEYAIGERDDETLTIDLQSEKIVVWSESVPVDGALLSALRRSTHEPRYYLVEMYPLQV